MSGYTNLDALAAHRYGIDSRAIELEKALEGAFLDIPVKGIRRQVRDGVRSRADLGWSRFLFIDRRAA
jgi:hypothetical protein